MLNKLERISLRIPRNTETDDTERHDLQGAEASGASAGRNTKQASGELPGAEHQLALELKTPGPTLRFLQKPQQVLSIMF
jgi:hypothetical protein